MKVTDDLLGPPSKLPLPLAPLPPPPPTVLPYPLLLELLQPDRCEEVEDKDAMEEEEEVAGKGFEEELVDVTAIVRGDCVN